MTARTFAIGLHLTANPVRKVTFLPMLNRVRAAVNHLKIFRTIVTFLAVQVVNLLSRMKRATKHLLGNHAMNVCLSTVVPHAEVSAIVYPCHISTLSILTCAVKAASPPT